MKAVKYYLSILFFCFMVLMNHADAAIVEDQSNWDNVTLVAWEWVTDTPLKQTITTGVDGTLSTIVISLSDWNSSDIGEYELINAQLRIGQQVFTQSENYLINGNGTSSALTFDFLPQNIFLSAGTLFELWLTGTPDHRPLIAFDRDYHGNYADGILIGQESFDLKFKTYMENSVPVPVPSGLLLLCAGLAVAYTYRAKLAHKYNS